MNPIQLLSDFPGRFFAVLDGPCGSGKSTLADHLQSLLPDLYVVHMDDYYIPMVQKTRERLSIPGGNADTERVLREVLDPYLSGKDAEVRPYICHADKYLPSWTLPSTASLLLEGSYSGLPQIASRADFRFYLTIDKEEQKERILRRNGPDIYPKFLSTWIPLEEAYHLHYHLPTSDWLVMDQTDLESILKG